MLVLLFQLLGVAQLGDLQIRLAPDQPIPYVYAGEPLILDFYSPAAIDVRPLLSIEADGKPPHAVDLGEFRLSPNRHYWKALRDTELQARGRYRVYLAGEDGRKTLVGTFCRIDRRTSPVTLPIRIAVESVSDMLAPALSALSIRSVSVDIDEEGIAESVPEISGHEVEAHVVLNLLRGPPASQRVQQIVKSLGGSRSFWELIPGVRLSETVAIARTIKKSSPDARIGFRVDSLETLLGFVRSGGAAAIDTLIPELGSRGANSIVAMRDAVERSGREGIDFLSRLALEGVQQDSPGELVRETISRLAAGYRSVELDGQAVYSDEGFGPAYCQISALVTHLGNTKYIGPLDLDADARAEVFRPTCRAEEERAWVIALWSGQRSNVTIIPLGNAVGLSLHDDLGNAQNLPELMAESLSLRLTGRPVFLSGSGGTVLAAASAGKVRTMVADILDLDGVQTTLKAASPELLDALKALQECGGEKSMRREFLTLVRSLPRLEELRGQGEIPSAAAIPLLAGAARVARRLCVLEGQVGNAFLEPFSETLARCAEYQSVYLADAASESGDRDAWFLNEISGLLDEARLRYDAGKIVEANALAALAEGRARCLPFMSDTVPRGQ